MFNFLSCQKQALFLTFARMESSQLQQYLPILILGIVALAFAGGTLIVSVLLGKTGRNNKTKDSAYECGMMPVGTGSTRMSVKFYLVAMLFILFDIEVVFLYPVGAILNAADSVFVLIEVIIFVFLLLVALVYVWRKGALDWR